MGADLTKLPVTKPEGVSYAIAKEAEERIRELARDDAEADMFLEQCGLKPYEPGKPVKVNYRKPRKALQ